jgi:hypothetical protein
MLLNVIIVYKAKQQLVGQSELANGCIDPIKAALHGLSNYTYNGQPHEHGRGMQAVGLRMKDSSVKKGRAGHRGKTKAQQTTTL